MVLAISAILWRQPKLKHFYERLMFQTIAGRVTSGISDPQRALIRLLEFVHTRVVTPPSDRPIGDVGPLSILTAGRGWCDQQANVLIQLARTLPVDGRLVFLRNERGASPHSIAEVYLDGA